MTQIFQGESKKPVDDVPVISQFHVLMNCIYRTVGDLPDKISACLDDLHLS